MDERQHFIRNSRDRLVLVSPMCAFPIGPEYRIAHIPLVGWSFSRKWWVCDLRYCLDSAVQVRGVWYFDPWISIKLAVRAHEGEYRLSDPPVAP